VRTPLANPKLDCLTSCWRSLLNTGRACWRNTLSLPLILALLLSLLLHLYLLSGVEWSLWGDDASTTQVLDARLQIASKPPAAPLPVAPPATKKHTPKAVAKSFSTPPEVAQTASEQFTPAEPVHTTEQTLAPPAPVANDDPPMAETKEEDTAETTAPVAPEEALPAPYQTVDTHFDLYVNGEKRPSGTATIEYRAQSGKYNLRWEIQANGLLRLLYPKLTQESSGEIGEHGLRPTQYRYVFGSRADKNYTADFNWKERVISLITSKGAHLEDLPIQTQDLLSFMYQFMYIPPTQEMRVTLTNGKRLGEYEYTFEGEEPLEIAGHSVNTMHIAHARGDRDEKVELWLATDYRNVPVKIRKIEKNGMVIEQIATRLVAE
jgi:Protein of unknown function (DUF3108)